MVRRKWLMLAAAVFLGGAVFLAVAAGAETEAEEPGGTLVKAGWEVIYE
ncbi:MAG: hypothetical protein KH828_04905 [Clostridiales bacterium]|nr:hypothetical protein [Clostridiales bacterium]